MKDTRQEQTDQQQETTTDPAENTADQPVHETELASEAHQQQVVDDLNNQIAELKDKYLRLYAEFENYKRRTATERIELVKTAARDTMSALLPVLDDFDRAKKAAENPATGEVFTEGIVLVYNKLYSILQAKGLQPMDSNGQPFDPEFHEAITEIPAPADDLKGKVVDTVEKGYALNDKIIRYAKVVVGR